MENVAIAQPVRNKFIEYYHTKPDEKRRMSFCGKLIEREDGELYVEIGVAICSPNDNFSREKGRVISLGRAEKKPFISFPFSDFNQDISFVENFHNYCRELHERINKDQEELRNKKRHV